MRLTQKIRPNSKAMKLPIIATWVILLLSLFSPPARSSVAQEASLSELEVKAAFLFNFVKFVEWPAKSFSSESQPFLVGVFGDDDFAAKLATLLKDKRAHNRGFEVRKITNPADAKGNHIFFISDNESRRSTQALEALKDQPVLTVGEHGQFLSQGGIIRFLMEDNQLRFEINTSAAEKANLTISSKLLRLAKNIKKEGK